MNSEDEADDEIPGRTYGEYVCNGGMDGKVHSFISWNPKEDVRICRKHTTEAKRQECRPLRKSDIPDEMRLFGRFECICLDEIGIENNWGSANAWKGHPQGCKKCKREVVTWNLNKLKGGNGNNKNGHLIELCGKCQSLKRRGISETCLTYKKKNYES